jgi:hypothetical protein
METRTFPLSTCARLVATTCTIHTTVQGETPDCLLVAIATLRLTPTEEAGPTSAGRARPLCGHVFPTGPVADDGGPVADGLPRTV